MGGLRPSSFQVSCIVDGDWAGDGRPAPNWSFDSIWGVGLLGSHEILEVQPDGTISIAPGWMGGWESGRLGDDSNPNFLHFRMERP